MDKKKAEKTARDLTNLFNAGKSAAQLAEAESSQQNTGIENFQYIDIDNLIAYKDNDEVFGQDPAQIAAIADDIRANGFHGAITVTPESNGKYRVLSGHQRVLAAKQAGLRKLPANIDHNTDENHQFEVWFKSNSLTRRMTPYRCYKMCIAAKNYVQQRKEEHDENYQGETRALISRITNINERQVTRYLQIDSLPPFAKSCCDDPSFPYLSVLKAANLSDLEKEIFDKELRKYCDAKATLDQAVESKDIQNLIQKVHAGKTDGFEQDGSDSEKKRTSRFNSLPEDAQEVYLESYNALKEKAKKYADEHKHNSAPAVIDKSLEEISINLDYLTESDAFLVQDPKEVSAALKMIEASLKKIRKQDNIYEF